MMALSFLILFAGIVSGFAAGFAVAATMAIRDFKEYAERTHNNERTGPSCDAHG